MRKWNLPLTYGPKIQPVKYGDCTQTIRVVNPDCLKKKEVGDLVRFYIWSGKPYHSDRVTITDYMPIIKAIPCKIYLNGMWIEPSECGKKSGLWWFSELSWLAKLDYINPPTGHELQKVLLGMHHPQPCGLEAQIIRWEPGARS